MARLRFPTAASSVLTAQETFQTLAMQPTWARLIPNKMTVFRFTSDAGHHIHDSPRMVIKPPKERIGRGDRFVDWCQGAMKPRPP